MKVVLDKGAYVPERAHPTDAGLDIKSREEMVVPKKGAAIFHTGVHVELPEKTAGVLMSKSGLNAKHGITSTGLIDEGYTGEIIVKLYNHSDTDYIVREGDKISQLVVVPVEYVDIEVVEKLAGSAHGSSGIGSTGR